MFSKPILSRYLIVAPNPAACAKSGVPASNLSGSIAHVAELSSTTPIIPPPNSTGSNFSNKCFLPYSTPIPVGPHILCALKAKKSQFIF